MVIGDGVTTMENRRSLLLKTGSLIAGAIGTVGTAAADRGNSRPYTVEQFQTSPTSSILKKQSKEHGKVVHRDIAITRDNEVLVNTSDIPESSLHFSEQAKVERLKFEDGATLEVETIYDGDEVVTRVEDEEFRKRPDRALIQAVEREHERTNDKFEALERERARKKPARRVSAYSSDAENISTGESLRITDATGGSGTTWYNAPPTAIAGVNQKPNASDPECGVAVQTRVAGFRTGGRSKVYKDVSISGSSQLARVRFSGRVEGYTAAFLAGMSASLTGYIKEKESNDMKQEVLIMDLGGTFNADVVKENYGPFEGTLPGGNDYEFYETLEPGEYEVGIKCKATSTAASVSGANVNFMPPKHWFQQDASCDYGDIELTWH